MVLVLIVERDMPCSPRSPLLETLLKRRTFSLKEALHGTVGSGMLLVILQATEGGQIPLAGVLERRDG